jgi:hypothetical protein
LLEDPIVADYYLEAAGTLEDVGDIPWPRFYMPRVTGWTNHDQWLDHDVHECQWFSSTFYANPRTWATIS